MSRERNNPKKPAAVGFCECTEHFERKMKEWRDRKGTVNETVSYKYKTCRGQEAIPYSTCLYHRKHLKYILAKLGIRSDDITNPKKVYPEAQMVDQRTPEPLPSYGDYNGSAAFETQRHTETKTRTSNSTIEYKKPRGKNIGQIQSIIHVQYCDTEEVFLEVRPLVFERNHPVLLDRNIMRQRLNEPTHIIQIGDICDQVFLSPDRTLATVDHADRYLVHRKSKFVVHDEDNNDEDE